MSNIKQSIASWVRSQSDVTQLCLALTVACFAMGTTLIVANIFLPLGARGGGLVAVGCFYLCHGVVEGLKKKQRNNESESGYSSIWPWDQRRPDRVVDTNGEASGSLAA